jgi:hypothetical protein
MAVEVEVPQKIKKKAANKMTRQKWRVGFRVKML